MMGLSLAEATDTPIGLCALSSTSVPSLRAVLITNLMCRSLQEGSPIRLR